MGDRGLYMNNNWFGDINKSDDTKNKIKQTQKSVRHLVIDARVKAQKSAKRILEEVELRVRVMDSRLVEFIVFVMANEWIQQSYLGIDEELKNLSLRPLSLALALQASFWDGLLKEIEDNENLDISAFILETRDKAIVSGQLFVEDMKPCYEELLQRLKNIKDLILEMKGMKAASDFGKIKNCFTFTSYTPLSVALREQKRVWDELVEKI
ncbi:MAG: hypothetical protein L3J07_04180 [Candidatus Magasanikbacteria bacterium]|nr:hypothetical protein [Candidatus Magasanikbacteria bacterium]